MNSFVTLSSINYFQAEQLDAQLQRMSEDLREIIEHINAQNRSSQEGATSDPVLQIGRVLNAHMDSLQWVDQSMAQVSQSRKVHPRELFLSLKALKTNFFLSFWNKFRFKRSWKRSAGCRKFAKRKAKEQLACSSRPPKQNNLPDLISHLKSILC